MRLSSVRQMAGGLLFITLLIAGDAIACSLPPEKDRTTAKVFGGANTVVLARVVGTELLDFEFKETPAFARIVIAVRYKALETFKGKTAEMGKAITTSILYCGAGFPALVGNDYLLFVEDFEDDMKEAPGFLKATAGSVGLIDALAVKQMPDEEALREVRALAGRQVQ